MGSWLKVPQPRLGQLGLMVLLVFTALVMPLSLDMYTPAVPSMTEHLSTTESMVNLTLVGYNFFFAVGLLVFGPLSDRIGRRPVLLVGLGTYAAASAACAVAPTIEVLIAARVVQALGAGASDAMTNSIVKDSFVEERRQVAISFVQLMFILGPVLAPIIGALIVTYFSWRATFVILAVVGVLCTVLAFLFNETLAPEDRVAKGSQNILGQFVGVLRNPSFSAFLGIASVFNIGFMAYISVVSYIYIDQFGLSEMGYSLFFSGTALITAIGPFAWELASRWMSARRFFSLMLVLGLGAGAAMLLVGQLSPVAFWVCFLVFAVVEASARPLSVNILLSQSDESVGTASSCINFVNTVAGSLGMLIVQLPFSTHVLGLGWTIVSTVALGAVAWVALLRSSVRVKGLEA